MVNRFGGSPPGSRSCSGQRLPCQHLVHAEELGASDGGGRVCRGILRIPVLMPNVCDNMTNQNDGHDYQITDAFGRRERKAKLIGVAVSCSAFAVCQSGRSI